MRKRDVVFETSDDKLLTMLGRHAGVGLWDAVIADGEPFGERSVWTWSPEFRHLLGFSTVEAFPNVYNSWMDRLHPDDLGPTMEVVDAVITDPAPVANYDTKFRLLHADGTYRWFRAVGVVIHDAAGVATRACGSLIDIHASELTEAENRARTQRELTRLTDARDASQERFVQISATSPDGIACTDANGIVTFWNDACVDLFGYAARDILGRHVDMAIAPDARLGADFDTVAAGLVGRTVEYPMQHRDGTRFGIDLSTSCWQDGGRRCYGFIGRDTRERKARERALATLAHRDALTGLPNRALLRERIEAALASAEPFGVMMIDLDGFKQINDTLGHEAGDAVLEVVAGRLIACLGDGDTAARFGGDEFTLVVVGGDPERLSAVAEAAIAAVSEPIDLSGVPLLVGASIGIASAAEHGTTVSELLSSADSALYAAKGEGRGCFRFFRPHLKQAAADLIACQRDLADAVIRREFELFYQPQHRLSDGALIGVEALLRWRHPQHGLLSPDRFLDVLERSRSARAVGEWVIAEACRQIAAWRRTHPDLRVGVNLFDAQLRDPCLTHKIDACLSANHLPPSALELEIPETIRLDIGPEARAALSVLKTSGVGIAFDDYGTGHANFSSLRDFPLTRLKIDRTFVQGMTTCEVDRAVVECILRLGRRIGASVIAEGIETPAQMAMLMASGCAEGQGFLLGRPAPAAGISASLLGSDLAA